MIDITSIEIALATVVKAGTCLLFATLGEIYAERSGVWNLGVEGMMIIGALTGFVTAYTTGNLWLAVILAMIASGLASLIHAFLCITLRANQILSGIALTLFGLGLTGFLGKPYIGTVPPSFASVPIPVLKEIPVLGQVLFNHDPLVYFSLILVPLLWFILFKTSFGLSIRAVGESPETADVMGVNVYFVRYFCVFLGGILAGLGGAYLSLAYTPMWIENMTAGRGWIAVALSIFSLWNPARAIFGAYLFGGLSALQYRLQVIGVGISAPLLLMLPYASTILVLIMTAGERIRRRIGLPSAIGIPYVRGEK